MKTPADFKAKMQEGTAVLTVLCYLIGGEYRVVQSYGLRRVTYATDKGFLLAKKPGAGPQNISWYTWPEAQDFYPVNDNIAEIKLPAGKLQFFFL